MFNHRNPPVYRACLIAMAVAVPMLAGCGMITEKSRIKIAKVGGQYFTRGDLEDAIRNMPIEEKPTIRTKGDLRGVLSDIIDDHIKQGQADALKEQGKINVPRRQAEIQYIMRYPQKYQEFLQLKNMLTEADVKQYEEDRELAIDREQERMYRDQALIYLINDAVQSGTLTVTDEQYEKQYELRKSNMLTKEQIAIQGVYLPLDAHEEVYAEAAKVRDQLEAGADPKVLAETYGEEKAGYLEVALANEGVDPKFVMFWEQASQRKEGDVFTAFIPGWQRNITFAGETKTEPIPDSQLICRVAQYVPARQMTLEEAKPELRSSILFSQMMERLRDQAGVEIYDDKLPDPGMYDLSTPASIMQQ